MDSFARDQWRAAAANARDKRSSMGPAGDEDFLTPSMLIY